MSEVRHIYLPYCIDLMPDGRYVVLNRNYKPVGMNTNAWVDYADPHLVAIKGLGPATREKLSAPGSRLTAERVYLYNDGCTPTDSAEAWSAYSERLRLLAKLTVTK